MPPGVGVGLSRSSSAGSFWPEPLAIREGLAVREDLGAPRFQDAMDHDEDVVRHEAPDHARDRWRDTCIWPEGLSNQGCGKKTDDEQHNDCAKVSSAGRRKLQRPGASTHVLHPRPQPDHSDYEHRGENDYQVLGIHGHTPRTLSLEQRVRSAMDLQLNDKLAVVSGSTAGIGYSIAEALAKEGARVVVNGRTSSAVDEAVARIGHGAVGFAGDLGPAAQAAELVRKFPDVDILVNNLGIFEPKPFEEIPDEDWRRFFDVNVLSGVRLARAFLPGMRRRDWGRIIFISSESGIQIPAEMIHYGVTKSAQISVARGIAETLVGTRITCNSVLPGPTQSRGVTEFVDQMAQSKKVSVEQVQKEFFDHVRPTSLLKRFITSEEVGAFVAFVASPLAAATNGAALRVDGGVVKSAF